MLPEPRQTDRQVAASAVPHHTSARPPITFGNMHLGVARHVREVLIELGVEPDAIIRDVGLDPRAFDKPNNVISSATLGRILSLATERSGCPYIGLLVGQRAGLHDLGVVGEIMQNAADLGSALKDLVKHLLVQNRAAVTRLEVRDGTACFTYSLYDPHVQGADIHMEGAVATTVSAIRELAGPQWAPSEVLLPRAAPPSVAPYWRFFRAPVRFDAEIAGILFPAEDLSLTRNSANQLKRREAEQILHDLEASAPITFSERLRRLLRTELLVQPCHAEDIAHQLSIHRRTLHRWLREEGTCFKTLRNEVKFMIAKQLLQATHMDATEIAVVLDFSELAAFTRAFRRWAGMSPTEWRARALARQSPAVAGS